MEESQSFGLALLYHVLPSSLLISYVLPTRHSVSSNLFHISIGPRSIWDPPNQPRWRVFQLFLSWIKLSSRHLYIFVHTFLNTSQEVAKIRKRKWKDVKATKCDKRCSFDTNPPWLLTQFARFWYFMAASGPPRRVANESKTPSKEKVPDMRAEDEPRKPCGALDL